MFTGLVLGKGELLRSEPLGADRRLVIRCGVALPDLVVGESVAVNGACLTVESGRDTTFGAYASAETLSRTNLDRLKPGGAVNLERALRVGDRLGGHIVSGHVDCLARVLEVRPAGLSRRIRLSFPVEFAPEVIPKGSVTLDGVSLTVNDCGNDFLEVNVIPETGNSTIVADWKPGDAVNMETDVLGKYVRRVLSFRSDDAGTRAEPRLNLDFLREHGFF